MTKMCKLGVQGLVALGIFEVLGLFVLAQQQSPPPVTVTMIGRNVYWLRGGGGSNDGVGANNAFIVGTRGVIVVDTKTTVDVERKVLAQIAQITSKPVGAVILTHSDEDHVGGLPALPSPITVIAQENCKKQMETSARSGYEPCTGCRTRGQIIPSQKRLPTKTFANTEELTLDGVRLRLYHWAPAHTSGDAAVYLPDEKIVFAGDLLVTPRPDPLIHVEKDGSATGWLDAAKGLLTPDADTYLTGHGGIMTKADVQQKYDYVQNRYNKIKTLVEQGKSIEEIKNSFGNPPAGQPATILIEQIYKEVSQKP